LYTRKLNNRLRGKKKNPYSVADGVDALDVVGHPTSSSGWAPAFFR
jgi:hypothetical protein